MSFGNKDRRSNDRRAPAATKAVLIVGARQVGCVCENISPGGAGLKLGRDVLIPPSCSLSLDGRVRRVAVVWRTEDRIGVRFAD